MLYLEDYLESEYLCCPCPRILTPAVLLSDGSVIEHLPQELRDRFTEVREMDLSVHSKCIRVRDHELELRNYCSLRQMQWTIWRTR